MRALCGAVLLVQLGCASTVVRLDGEFETPVGAARTACEKEDWLVVAPTRAEFVDEKGRRSQTRDDGVALYRVGASRPESIPSLADDMGQDSPSFARHGPPVRSHDTKQVIAGSLGVAGVLAIVAGTILFVSSFETETVQAPDGTSDQQQRIDGLRAGLGGGLVGVGFGLGIAGIAVNPGQAERSRAEAARYVFLPPEDRREEVVEMTAKYNQAVRARCERAP
jgi:hypothetical protein